MKKYFLAATLTALLFGADEAGYYIEAQGEFGKELETLVNKYKAQDANVSINIYKNKPDDTASDGRKRRFINIGVDKSQNFDMAKGEEIFLKRCASCHGNKGEKRAHGVSRPIKDLSAQEINDSIIAYANDPDYGGEKRHIMKPFAVSINYRDLGDVISYLRGENAFVYTQEGNSPISRKPTEQGTYLE